MLTPEQLREVLLHPLPEVPARCRFGRPHRWFGTLVTNVHICETCDSISDERPAEDGGDR